MSTKNYAIEIFFGRPKKWPLGSENGHFWPKTSSFGQKWRFLVVQKFSKKIFFSFFYILDHSSLCLMKTKKIGPPLGPFWPIFDTFWPPFDLCLVSLNIYIELWSCDTSFKSTRWSRRAELLLKFFGPLKISIVGQNTMFLAQNLDFCSPWPHTLRYGGIW